jgi:hypothetical protein
MPISKNTRSVQQKGTMSTTPIKSAASKQAASGSSAAANSAFANSTTTSNPPGLVGRGVHLHPVVAPMVNANTVQALQSGGASWATIAARGPQKKQTVAAQQNPSGASGAAPSAQGHLQQKMSRRQRKKKLRQQKQPLKVAEHQKLLIANFNKFLGDAKSTIAPLDKPRIRTDSGELQAVNTFQAIYDKANDPDTRRDEMAYSQSKVKGEVVNQLSTKLSTAATQSFGLNKSEADYVEQAIHSELIRLSEPPTTTYNNLSREKGGVPVGKFEQWKAKYDPNDSAITVSSTNRFGFTVKNKNVYLQLVSNSFKEMRGQDLHPKIENNLRNFISDGSTYDGKFHVHGMHAEVAAVSDALTRIDESKEKILNLANDKPEGQHKIFKQEVDKAFGRIVKADGQEEDLIRLITLKGSENAKDTAQGGDFCACVQCRLTLGIDHPTSSELILDTPTEYGDDAKRKS